MNFKIAYTMINKIIKLKERLVFLKKSPSYPFIEKLFGTFNTISVFMDEDMKLGRILY